MEEENSGGNNGGGKNVARRFEYWAGASMMEGRPPEKAGRGSRAGQAA